MIRLFYFSVIKLFYIIYPTIHHSARLHETGDGGPGFTFFKSKRGKKIKKVVVKSEKIIIYFLFILIGER